MSTKPRICARPGCKNEIAGAMSVQRLYCSSKCKLAALRLRKKVNAKTKAIVCSQCEATFTAPDYSSVTFCSDACRQAARAVSRLPWNLGYCPYEAGHVRLEGHRLPDPGMGF